MPPKRVAKKRVKEMRHHFREFVDWVFDGNLSLGSRVLAMSLSTVQKYYQDGPRRMSSQVIQRINDLEDRADWGHWIVGKGISRGRAGPPRSMGEFGYQNIIVTPAGPAYLVPLAVMWRVDRVVEIIGQAVNAKRNQRLAIVFSPIVAGLKAGLYVSALGKRPRFRPARVRGRRAIKSPHDLIKEMGMGIERAQQIHRLCEFWEAELGIDQA